MPTAQSFWNSCTRLFVLSTLLWFSLPLFAADRNLTEDLQQLTQHNECERLLDADLSGHYVATRTIYSEGRPHEMSQLVQLRRLGQTSAYTVNVASMDLDSSGIRELRFVRSGDSWVVGDPRNPNATVNLLTVLRDDNRILFRFENASDPHGFAYDAAPVTDATPVQGDILNPNELHLRFMTGFEGDIRFTKVKLDRSFETVVSQSLKSILATKLDPEGDSRFDYLITVQMKSPLLTEEAAALLGISEVYPLDAAVGANSDGPFYRFAIPAHIYKLLESIGLWTRSWQVAQIDALPSHMVNEKVGRAIAAHVQMQRHGSDTAVQTEVPARPPERTLSQAAPPPAPTIHPRNGVDERTEASQALAHLQTLGGSPADFGGSRPHRVEAGEQHPRDLDEGRPPRVEGDEEESGQE